LCFQRVEAKLTIDMTSPVEISQAKRMGPKQLDALAERRAELLAELDGIRLLLTEQVEGYGFTPPRAEKSKRLLGESYQITLSYGEATEIRDAEVEKLERSCPIGLFSRLFCKVTQYKLCSGASMVLAGGTLPKGSPRNLRQMFQAAVIIKQKTPALRIERVKDD